MLSTQYRLKLEKICNKIINGNEVLLEEMIWCEKLSKSNQSAASILRKARRKAANPDMTEDSLDGFLNALDIGGIGNERYGISGFNGADDIVDFFTQDKPEDWRNTRLIDK
jgi:hypothetical protein